MEYSPDGGFDLYGCCGTQSFITANYYYFTD